MRGFLTRNARTVAVAVVAAVIASVATAGAASLITGKQIKDGSISAKDLNKALRSQLTRRGAVGAAGPQGLKGDKGDAGTRGPSAFEPLPSGVTITGGGILDLYVAGSGSTARDYSALSARLSAPLRSTGADRNVFLAPGTANAVTDNISPLCEGSADAPTAPKGLLCVYVKNQQNVFAGFALQVNAGASSSADGADGTGFFVVATSAAAGELLVQYTWAYTAS